MMLPIIIGGIIGSLVHGAGTSIFGYYAPFMVVASVMMPIAAGLITTFQSSTTFGRGIAYTGLSGLGYGIGFSGPQNAVQTVLGREDVPLGLSVMLFAQSFGPAVAVAVAQVVFENELGRRLGGIGLGLTKGEGDGKGLLEILKSVPEGMVGEVVGAVDGSLGGMWYFVVGLAGATVGGSLLMEWRSVKSKRE